MHPRVKMMLKSPEGVVDDINFSLEFASSDRQTLDIREFHEFHYNMFWVTPKEELTNLLNVFIN